MRANLTIYINSKCHEREFLLTNFYKYNLSKGWKCKDTRWCQSDKGKRTSLIPYNNNKPLLPTSGDKCSNMTMTIQNMILPEKDKMFHILWSIWEGWFLWGCPPDKPNCCREKIKYDELEYCDRPNDLKKKRSKKIQCSTMKNSIQIKDTDGQP